MRLNYLFILITLLSIGCVNSSKKINRNINKVANTNQKFSLIASESMCMAEYPLFMGASITAELGQMFGYQQAVWLGNKLENIFIKENRSKQVKAKNVKYGKSPTMMFLKEISPVSKNIYSMAIPVTLIKRHSGSGQIQSLISKKYKQCHNITSIFAIDLFYWDAIYNLCEDSEFDSLANIDQIIKFAKSYNAPIFLGTVPNEDPSLVHIDLATSPWKKPNVSCLNKINQKLKANCLVESHCYLIDMYHLNERLKRGESLQHSSGWSVDYFAMRPDGIHISPKGSEIILERLKNKYIEHPISCN